MSSNVKHDILSHVMHVHMHHRNRMYIYIYIYIYITRICFLVIGVPCVVTRHMSRGGRTRVLPLMCVGGCLCCQESC